MTPFFYSWGTTPISHVSLSLSLYFFFLFKQQGVEQVLRNQEDHRKYGKYNHQLQLGWQNAPSHWSSDRKELFPGDDVGLIWKTLAWKNRERIRNSHPTILWECLTTRRQIARFSVWLLVEVLDTLVWLSSFRQLSSERDDFFLSFCLLPSLFQFFLISLFVFEATRQKS